jgi:hypothetical protein
MRAIRWMSLAVAAALAVVVVSPVRAQSVDVKPQEKSKIKRDKNVLTADEIAERPDITNAYDAVKLLRPNFLKAIRSKGGLAGTTATGGYRPDAVGKPVTMGGGGTGSSGTGTGGGSTGEPAPEGGLGPGGAGNDNSQYASSGASANVVAVLDVDDVKQPDADEMRNIRVAEIFEIRYLSGNQAAGRYGAGHEAGAILIKTNRLVKR